MPEDPELDQALADWGVLRHLVLALDDDITADVGDVGVPGQSFGVLHLLLHAPQRQMPMTELARRMFMTAGGFTKLADRLGQAGLIDRRGAAADRRVVFATLTKEGITAARQAERRYRDAISTRLLGTIDAGRLAAAVEALRPLLATAPALPADFGQRVEARDPALPERRRGR
ncbi:MAG: MarR family transcriptional regulator [Jatrophihabitans sp.]|nr:MAG: MarR family transcriptional regulator [Jatrophihabitans sp.]